MPRAQKKSGWRASASVAAMLLRLRAGLDVRRAKVRRVRAKLREQNYENLLKLDVAAQRLVDEMMK